MKTLLALITFCMLGSAFGKTIITGDDNALYGVFDGAEAKRLYDQLKINIQTDPYTKAKFKKFTTSDEVFAISCSLNKNAYLCALSVNLRGGHETNLETNANMLTAKFSSRDSKKFDSLFTASVVDTHAGKIKVFSTNDMQITLGCEYSKKIASCELITREL